MVHPKDIAKMEETLSGSGIPVAELCRRANIAETTWGRWKGGKFKPSYSAWERVADAYQAIIKGDEKAALQ